MIFGIGVDLVEIERMAALLQRRGDRAVQHVLSAEECAAGEAITPRLLAKRFAAKEALAKAMGTGLRHPLGLRAITITHDAIGRPGFSFTPQLSEFIAGLGIRHIHLSISDERGHAMAFVIAEQ